MIWMDAWIEISPASRQESNFVVAYSQSLPEPVKRLFSVAKQTIERGGIPSSWDLAIRLTDGEFRVVQESGLFGPTPRRHGLGEEYTIGVTYEDSSYKVSLFITK